MKKLTQTELKVIYLAVYQLAIAQDKNKLDSDYLSVQRLTDDEIDDITISIRHKLSYLINDNDETVDK